MVKPENSFFRVFAIPDPEEGCAALMHSHSARDAYILSLHCAGRYDEEDGGEGGTVLQDGVVSELSGLESRQDDDLDDLDGFLSD